MGKNILIFVPLFFCRQIFNLSKIWILILGFISFSLIASAVYIINDIQDAEKDRKHPKKKYRPIASGKISKKSASVFLMVLLVIAFLIMVYASFLVGNYIAIFLLPIIYLILNIAYSNGLKNTPLLDIAIIALGFVIRLYYCSYLSQIKISDALLLTVISASFFLGFGKRRNELKKGTSTRKVLKAYNIQFLDNIMYVFVGLTLVFYSLWTISKGGYLIWTVPFTMMIVADYCLIIESDSSDGDPAEVLRHSKSLLSLLVIFSVVLFMCLYV
ncbi:UbiA prenyltransferase family protein [Limosilactobacillus fastidiosus]|uniref:UbiA prenyltransferase family protein n=1 Tax=Limosilactobacillus fastidiosus TaxID=2759855 RepID=UPI001C71FA43|nr:UbiA prenyltransferase family protein [Limosilactobacillus fastidiosus]MCD7083978.1 UbiA prenyltransferase family protein [Limosilactobacillus fastidiosus]